MEPIQLTQYSHGAGCGCKIAPKVLEEILKGSWQMPDDKNLLVGNHSKDDAAVYDLGNGTAIISTTDFFMPIVDDPFEFGKIASANAISDVYAMGGRPLMAIAILGWPVEKIPTEVAQRVIEGARTICAELGIPLAGGHSIDSPEPIFGLAVTGLVDIAHIKQNNKAELGDYIFLTKPLGVGVLSTAQKRGLIAPEHVAPMIAQLSSINKLGALLGQLPEVTAMTDVTGFGLLGHLYEMASGSNLAATISYASLPLAPGVKDYIARRIFPDATTRNWNNYGQQVKFEKGVNVMEAFTLLPDPQTNGGLLFTVKEEGLEKVKQLLQSNGAAEFSTPIGRMEALVEKSIIVGL